MNLDNQIVIYQTEDGQTQIDVRMENDTVWLSANQMAMLFDREESNIRRHIINVFADGELIRENNVQNLHVNGVKKTVLMIAESRTEEKDVMVKVVINLINKNNYE